MRTLLLILVLAVLLGGCIAKVTHTAVPPDDNGSGLRYYQASPYLLVNSDSKGGLQWRILYLPDQTKKMMAHPTVLGGRSELTLQFRNGVLAGTSELGDTSEVPRAVIAAAQSAIPLIAGLFEAPSARVGTQSVPAPYLYKIVVQGDTVSFIGKQGDTPITVTLREK